MNGLTLTEIADALGIDKWAAEKRLRKAGVEKLTREALYPLDAVERIKNSPPPGRPKKSAEAPKIGVIAPITGYIEKCIPYAGYCQDKFTQF